MTTQQLGPFLNKDSPTVDTFSIRVEDRDAPSIIFEVSVLREATLGHLVWAMLWRSFDKILRAVVSTRNDPATMNDLEVESQNEDAGLAATMQLNCVAF